ncbi:serine/arginine repetitive matrix protein 2-like isoform X2 [Euwallacea fornicatus]|uniref:serine/arginine repetitive matrix protein 2-like isoform X2 n=1 Tax=Euwallacea fornicatus TaxID=995702 RepID=UPI00338DF8C5
MSAETVDVARIKDEDVLRRMWQETEDFGRKKEIRSHMYKLREARLKDFYTSSDVNTEVHKSTMSATHNVSKTNVATSHTDSLGDQSYVTLKSKEVRDSESPTRDTYKSIAKHQDQGWNVQTSHEKSQDGKTHTSTHLATTSGSQQIDGGSVNYVAKVQEKSSVFQDGNDKNFTRAAGTCSSSIVHQEASGGDEHSNYRSTSSKTSSSSQYISESKTEEIQPTVTITRDVPYTINEDNAKSVSEKTYTTNAPKDLKAHPNYIEGKTKVTQETKTLADGTVVTTTRYETKDGNSTQTATHKKYSNVASSHSSVSNKSDIHESRNVMNESQNLRRSDQRAVEYVVEPSTRSQQPSKSESIHTSKVLKDSRNDSITVVNDGNSPYEVTTRTTTTKTVVSEAPQTVKYVEIPIDQSLTSKTTTIINKAPATHYTTATHHITTDSKQRTDDQFISTERQHEEDTRDTSKRPEPIHTPSKTHPAQEPYVQPDRRQSIKPGKSELHEKAIPTEGQYSTTYRSDFTNKKISVEVSATHDAFARSLRSITPERISRNQPRTSSNQSLRSTGSPEKMKYPSRSSPDRVSRSRSPKKSVDRFSSNETFICTTGTDKKTDATTKKASKSDYYSADTLIRKSKNNIDSSTITRKKGPRSPSPTVTATSDFEYVWTNKDISTNLNEETSNTRTSTKETRPSSLEISSKRTSKSPTKQSPTKSPPKDTFEKPKLLRTNTYEERVKEILGLSNKDTKEIRRSSLERNSLRSSTIRDTTNRTTSSDDVVRRLTERKSPVKEAFLPTRKSPTKEKPVEFNKFPEDKKSPIKSKPSLSEFPSQIRKSPEKQPLGKPSEKKPSIKSGTTISEFPAQQRKSPEKEPLEPYPEKISPIKFAPSVSEFPSQIRKSPEKVPLEPYPEKKSPTKQASTICEFPSQIRKSPEREPLEPYPEKKSPTKQAPSVSEIPSEVRKSPEKKPLEARPAETSPTKQTPTICEYPSQIRKSSEKESLEPYPEKKSLTKQAPSISEFPSQIRASPEKTPLEPYPEKKSPTKQAPTICEFPSQIRKSPEREPLEPYPEKKSPAKQVPSISEFPSQIRKSPEKTPLEPYPETKTSISQAPTICEFPSQIRKSPEREPLEPYPEKKSPAKQVPSISEFPSQIRKSPEKTPLEPYPETKTSISPVPTICEFPSQIRKSPEREPLEPYPEKMSPIKSAPSESEYLAQTRKSPEQPLISENVPVKSPKKQTLKSPERKPSELPRKPTSTICDFPPQTRNSPEKPSSPPKLSPLKPKTSSKNTRTKSESSTTSEDEDVEEQIHKTTMETYESRVPVSEPIMEKKIFRQMCKADEEIIDKKKRTQELIESEIEDTRKKVSTKTAINEKKLVSGGPKLVKKPTITTKTTTITTTSKKVTSPKEKIPSKKATTVIEKIPSRKIMEISENSITKCPKVTKTTTVFTGKIPTPVKLPQTIYRVEKTKMVGTTEYQGEYSKSNKVTKEPLRKTTKPQKKITIFDVEKSQKLTQDKTIHLRTNRVDDTVNKKKISKTAITTNGYATKPSPKATPVKGPLVKPKQITTCCISPCCTPIKPKSLKPVETKKHVTTATITVANKPKTTIPTKRPFVAKLKPKQTNGYSSSESDDESIVESIEGSFVDLTEQRQFSTRDDTKNVVTTKTVLINEDGLDREIVVNLQRSKSSREPTPDRLCPRPLTSDEEEDSIPARYPDQISEPDDQGSLKKKPKKLTDIPIFESDDNEDNRITDITDAVTKITKVDRVEETDESLLSINKKISKFLNTAEKLTKEPLKPKPAKVQRPTLEVSEDLKEDECLLSVSDKVSKFINTAEQLSVSTLPERPKSPRFDEVSTQKKVSEFKSPEMIKKPSEGPAPKVLRPDLTNIDESLRADECLLSVSDKVSKFVTTAEKLTNSGPKSVSLSKIDVKAKSPTREVTFTTKNETTDFIESEKLQEMRTRKSVSISPERTPIKSRNSISISPERRSPSPGEKTTTRRSSSQYTSILKKDGSDRSYTSTSPETSPGTVRRGSQEESTKISNSTRLRSNESIKKAKALFENISKEQETVTKQKDILSRPSVFEARRKAEEETRNEEISRRSSLKTNSICSKQVDNVSRRSPSPKKSPERRSSADKIEIRRFRASSPEKIPEVVAPEKIPSPKLRSREQTPEGDLPHYMMPLDRNLRVKSPHREDINQVPAKAQLIDQVDTKHTKFGVTLRRTDSGKTAKTTDDSSTNSERRKSSITLEKRVTEEEIEEIFDLEVLEELLEKVMGYELRRKIRTQIRLVKKLITDDTLEEYILKRKSSILKESVIRRGSSPSKTTKPGSFDKTGEYQCTYTRKFSPERKVVEDQTYRHTELVDRRSSIENTSEYKYSYNERKSSSEISKINKEELRSTRSSISPERKLSKTIDIIPSGKTTISTKVESVPGGTRTTTTTTTERNFVSLKKAAPPTKTPIEDSQPDWVKQRNLRNARENVAVTSKKSLSSTTTSTKKDRVRISPTKEVKSTDLITSSYGVGPTDENGTPLFGLKALRAQNKSEKSKVQGTVIQSEYYSENDNEPVGQVSVTRYSTDPRDLNQDGIISSDGKVTSVTTTQKFGYKNTPSLRSLTDNRKEICDSTEKSSSKTTKINRRGSVKEISKKFIDNAVETLKSERQTTYPKAGLILRSSSFKSTNGEAELDSRESSPDGDKRSKSSTTTTIRTMKSSSSGETFLSNKNQISGVQDVLTRMKNEESVEGDSEEDIAARGLLNKFIGSQVILSGMEACAKSSKTKTMTTSPTSVSVRRTTKITSTITEGGKPTTKTRIFQRPVTEKELETVWDEQSLRLLLEQSTDYEERRIVRARLRQIMAELEDTVDVTKEVVKVGDATTKVTTRVAQQHVRAPKPMSPFAKFRQLDKQNSVNKPTPPSTPGTPRGSGPMFKFTDPALTQSANTIKDRLLHWCRMKTKEYENIQLDNFSSSWADGLAFCALIHHFLPDAFDYSILTPKDRRYNFELAFRIADEKADIFPLLDVEDMLETRRPDWKCVFTYVQSIYRRFKDED